MILYNNYPNIHISQVKDRVKNKPESIDISYAYKGGEQIKQVIQISYLNTNLGKGFLYFFICPYTGKRCRKMYLIGKYFSHRKAHGKMYYESQTHTPTDRLLYKFPKANKALDKINSKYFRKQYAKKPTKRYLKLLKQTKSVNTDEIINIISNII